MIDTIANVLHELYAGFDYAAEGEDHNLMRQPPEGFDAARTYWSQINEARAAIGETSYDGLLIEAHFTALSETDPNLRTDALLRVAATALAYAASVQRQTDAFNAEDKPKGKRKGAE